MAEALKAAQAAQAKRLSKLTDELQDGALERRPPQPHARRALASTCPLSRAWARCWSQRPRRCPLRGWRRAMLPRCTSETVVAPEPSAAPRRERDAAHTPTQPSRRCCFGRLIQALSHARARPSTCTHALRRPRRSPRGNLLPQDRGGDAEVLGRGRRIQESAPPVGGQARVLVL
jgi:hypothetical protein